MRDGRHVGSIIFFTGALLMSLMLPASGMAAFASGCALPVATDPKDSASNSVVFNVDILPLSSLTVSFQLQADTTLSGGSISPGQTVTASAAVSVPSTVNLAITYNGVSTSVAIPGLGTSYDVGVPGLGLSYAGVSLGVLLNFSGTILAQSSVSGQGHGGGGPLTWTSSGARTFSLTANSSATEGNTVTSSLTNLQYGISMGIDAGAVIPLLGHYVVHILNFGSIGIVHGTPSSVQSTYQIPASGSSGLGAGLDSGSGLLLLVGIVAALILVAAVAVILSRRMRKPPIA
jgi:hypothetical protein